MERNFSCPLIPTSTRPLPIGRTTNGSRHRVRPLHGVNGKTPGGFLKNHGRGKQTLGNERGDPLFTIFSRKLQKMDVKNSIYFVTDRSFTADSGLL